MLFKNRFNDRRKVAKLWRVRIWATLSLMPLTTVLSPLAPSHTPVLPAAKANHEQIDKILISSKELHKNYAKELGNNKYNWGAQQFKCLSILWHKESSWDYLSDNPHSSAFGIAQMLREKSKDPYRQIRNGLKYIEHRYETPCRAWNFWQKNYYY